MQRNAALFTAKAEIQNEAKVNLGNLQKHGSGCSALRRHAALCSALRRYAALLHHGGGRCKTNPPFRLIPHLMEDGLHRNMDRISFLLIEPWRACVR
jgi:hypothetical protein